MTKPLTPADIDAHIKSGARIPDFVLVAVNMLLLKATNPNYIVLKLKDVKTAIFDQLPARRPFDPQWLDFEPAYREAGWDVIYDRPGYNEDYEPTWTFKKSAS